jgi:hypothetical protein
MKTPSTLIVLFACGALLSACDKLPKQPPIPTMTQPDGTRKPAQESDTKLLPGQNNDHSAPLSTPR